MLRIPKLSNFRVVAENLQFPEGPVALDDGSIAFTEIRGRRVSRFSPDGQVSVIAETGGGPNGLAAGTLMSGHITLIDPRQRRVLGQVKVPDMLPTNLCFGGPDRHQVFMTLAETGQLAVMDSDVPGLKLNY